MITTAHVSSRASMPSTTGTTLSAALGVVLMEFGDFAMFRRMLRGNKATAESMGGAASQSADATRRNPPL